jgi:hypothetical protein
VETYSRDSALDLFRRFSNVTVRVDYPFTYGFRFLTFWLPVWAKRALGRGLGWHLMIRAVK